LFTSFETAALDSWVHLSPLKRVESVVIVEITDEDYSSYFKARSPLDPVSVSAILEAVASGNPEVIVVDLEIDPESVTKHVHLLDGAAPSVVWARTANVIGGRLVLPLDEPGAFESVSSGIALFPEGPDGVVRSYERTFRRGRSV